MKKHNLKSLKLQKNTISNFNAEEINGGVGGPWVRTYNCEQIEKTAVSCPPFTAVSGCHGTSYIYC